MINDIDRLIANVRRATRRQKVRAGAIVFLALLAIVAAIVGTCSRL